MRKIMKEMRVGDEIEGENEGDEEGFSSYSVDKREEETEPSDDKMNLER